NQPVTKPADSDSQHDKDSLDEILKVSDDPLGMIERAEDRAAQQAEDIFNFYQAPVTRFVYNTFFYIAFLIVFSYSLLVSSSVGLDYLDYFIGFMVLSFLAEEMKQAMDSSLSDYLADGWNQLDCLAIVLYLCGSAGRLVAYFQLRQIEGNSFAVSEGSNLSTGNSSDIYSSMQANDTYLSTFLDCAEASSDNFIAALWGLSKCESKDYILPPSLILNESAIYYFRTFYAFSLFSFWIRLMYVFSFSIVLGPKLIMITRMVVNDMLPFMLINTVLQLGYGASYQVMTYASAYYSPS
ncbi:Transient receptor putative cation channel subfamily M member 2, partial [Cichlidogyrus casuarinus]